MTKLAIGIAILGLSVIADSVLAAPPPAAASGWVAYSHDRLTVRLNAATLDTVLADVARQSGASIRGDVVNVEGLSLSFDNQPLRMALERLVPSQSFALWYDKLGMLRTIEFLDRRDDATSDVTPRPIPPVAHKEPTTEVAATASDPGNEELNGPFAMTALADRLIERNDPIELIDTLTDIYGESAAAALAELAANGPPAMQPLAGMAIMAAAMQPLD